MADEVLGCHAVRPRSEWGSRYGIATCQGCLSKGYVILPETLHGEQPRERKDGE